MEPGIYHIPVLLHPSLEGLNIKRDGTYVDVTLGGGGHSRALLAQLGPGGRLFSFDQDADAIEKCERQREAEDATDAEWTLVRSNFRYLRNWMRYYEVDGVDGILADLGVSSHHLDEASRGFSFRADAPLDMRMNQSASMSAAEVINRYSIEQLTSVFRLYGELHQAPRLAAAVVKARSTAPIETTFQLVQVLTPLVGRDREKKDLARAFQALRIEVNGEMEALRSMLMATANLLRPGGRLVVISYHSLEDRLVKNLMRAGNVNGEVEQDVFGRSQAPFRLIGKPIAADEEEIRCNPRSRSARLRVAEKV
ncbi:MAG: 16S rRNA (cytosine(1402)-N(4))-methyltransferase RsmH [Bacteroidaceae bacterium]|nr:16S rRNA (cytosine(1402)-N(4))-methyltransferase RsmH [Bacteroidaceae bacterium]